MSRRLQAVPGTPPGSVAALAALIFLSAAWHGHWLDAIVGAGGFYWCSDRLVAWFVASKTGAGGDDSPATDIDDDLADVLARLESARVEMAAEVHRRMHTRLPLGLACGVGCWAWLQRQTDPAGLIDLAFLSAGGAGFGWAWAASTLSERYRCLYKEQVLPRLASGFGQLTFRPARDVDISGLRRQRLFDPFDRATAEDEVIGSYHGVPVSIVELRLERDQDKSRSTVFDGLLATVTLPRTLRGTTAIIADAGLFGPLRDLFRKQGARVVLEDPEFEGSYQVYGTDQIAARALLTPAFMERFRMLGARTGFCAPVALAEDNRLIIALPKTEHTDLFEPPSLDRPAASRSALARLHGDIAAVLAVADAVLDLDQSVRRGARDAISSASGGHDHA